MMLPLLVQLALLAAAARACSVADHGAVPDNRTDNSRAFRNAAAACARRAIPSAPVRILDAPDLVDDYYLNLVDWSESNKVAVALSSTLYVWDADTSEIAELTTLKDNAYICSVSWLGQHLALGTSDAKVQLWDPSTGKQLRSMKSV